MGAPSEFWLPRNGQPTGLFRPSDFARSRGIAVLTVGDHSFDAATGIRTAPSSTTNDFQLSATPGGLGVFQSSGGYSVNASGYRLNWAGDWTAIFIGAPASNAQTHVFAQEATDYCVVGIGFDRNFAPTPDGSLAVTLLQSGANRSGGAVSGASNGTTRCFLLRKRGTTISAYIDGVEQTFTTSDGFAGAPSFAVTDALQKAGHGADGTWRWNQPICATAFLNSALSDNECAQVSRISGFYAALVAPLATQVETGGASIDGSATVTGASTTSSPGTLTATGGAAVTLTGAGTTANAGTVSASAEVSATGTLTGTGATASHGTLTATGGATATLTGAATTSNAGAVSASAEGSATATITGAETTSLAGTLTVAGDATTSLSGIFTTAYAGTLTATGAATVSLTGADVTSAAGAVLATAGGSATAALVGAALTSSAGTMAAAGDAAAALTGATTTAAAGTVTASEATNAIVTLTGASASATVGALSASGAAQIVVTGVQVTASAGTVSASASESFDGAVTLTGAATASYAGSIIAAALNDAEYHAYCVWNHRLESGVTAGNTLTGILAALQQGISVGDLARAVWTQELPIP